MYVVVVEQTGNAKLGDVSATMIPQQSCPKDCVFLHSGCYAEYARTRFTTDRINKAAARRKLATGKLRLVLARQEAAAVRALSGRRQLRGHVVGDCSTAKTAGIVGRAYVAHTRKHGQPHWTYTHAWRTVARAAWKGATVLASCDKVSDIAEARARGYAAALVLPTAHSSHRAYQLAGETIIPCPAQFHRPDGRRAVTCEDCTLCKRPDFLLARKFSIGFQPDHQTEKRIALTLSR